MRAKTAAALFAALVLCAPMTARAQTAEETAMAEKAEALISARIDAARAQNAPDAPRLASDAELVKIARARSSAIAHGAPFSHQDAAGNYPAIDRVKARFGPYGYIGENLASEIQPTRPFNIDSFAKTTVDGWMASEEHRENILLPNYTTSGIGVVIVGGLAYATQVFRGPPPPAKRAAAPRPKGAAAVWAMQSGF